MEVLDTSEEGAQRSLCYEYVDVHMIINYSRINFINYRFTTPYSVSLSFIDLISKMLVKNDVNNDVDVDDVDVHDDN